MTKSSSPSVILCLGGTYTTVLMKAGVVLIFIDVVSMGEVEVKSSEGILYWAAIRTAPRLGLSWVESSVFRSGVILLDFLRASQLR